MSLGTQRKFMLIATLAYRTNLYLPDEPTNALDAKSLEVLAKLIREASRHSLVILSCHDRNFLNLLEHGTLVLHDGHITQDLGSSGRPHPQSYSSYTLQRPPGPTALIAPLVGGDQVEQWES